MIAKKDYDILDIKHAFLAGLIEGDGSIMLKAHKDPRKQRGVTFGMYVKVSNTKKELLDFLKENFGGCVSKGWQPKGKGRNAIYDWSIGSEDAQVLLLQLYPYLIIKKKQAKLAVKFQTILSAARRAGIGDSQEEYNKKVQMVKEMHKLNAKGSDKQWLKL